MLISKKTIALLISILTVYMFTLTVTLNVNALNVISRAEMGIDESLVRQDDNYMQPDSIIITPIFIEGDEIISDYDWYKGLFYYQTARLNQGDFLFHYVISKSGQIFKGNLKGEEYRIRQSGNEFKPIIVAYFSNSIDTEFNPVSKSGLSDLIIDIANRNAISLDSVYVRSIQFQAKQNEAVTAQFGLLGGKWERSLKEITNNLKQFYNPQSKNFDISVSNIELPANAVNYGDNVVMNISLTNNSNFILLKGSVNEPIMNLSGANTSKFFLNGVWSSLSQVEVMGEATYLKPGETKTFQVRLFVPLYFGLIKERFYLSNSLGKRYVNTEFDVSLTVNHTPQKVVEIINTQQLNVHENPWYNSPNMSRVTLGQRFIVLEDRGDGWIKIDLNNQKSGWVVIKYVKWV